MVKEWAPALTDLGWEKAVVVNKTSTETKRDNFMIRSCKFLYQHRLQACVFYNCLKVPVK